MAIETRGTDVQEPDVHHRPRYDPAVDTSFPPPDLGRTVHIVDTVVNVHPDETPHPRVRRGDMGPALFNYGRNTVSTDPIARTNSNRARDKNNYFTDLLRKAPAGTVNPHKTPVPDPAAMARHIKRAGKYFGADIVGIGKAHPALLYAGGSLLDNGFLVEGEAGGSESPAELCRNGLIITEKYGARIHLSDAILTDLPLVADKPIDLGVNEFCKVCRKCAETCPTNSITFDANRQVFNGVEKFKIKWETCYKLRPIVSDIWNICLTCSTICPYTKPNVWWRTMAVQTLRTTPIPLRPA